MFTLSCIILLFIYDTFKLSVVVIVLCIDAIFIIIKKTTNNIFLLFIINTDLSLLAKRIITTVLHLLLPSTLFHRYVLTISAAIMINRFLFITGWVWTNRLGQLWTIPPLRKPSPHHSSKCWDLTWIPLLLFNCYWFNMDGHS